MAQSWGTLRVRHESSSNVGDWALGASLLRKRQSGSKEVVERGELSRAGALAANAVIVKSDDASAANRRTDGFMTVFLLDGNRFFRGRVGDSLY